MSFIISDAVAAAPAGAAPSGGFDMIMMIVIFIAIFYFMIFRPQSKRTKEHNALMSSMHKGDEVLTNGGLLGKISKISDDNDYLQLALSDDLTVTIKKDFITAVLPKGTLKSL